MLRLRPFAVVMTTMLSCLLTLAVTTPVLAGDNDGPPTSGAGGLSVQGSSLALDGRPVRLSGINGYSLTTFWPVNWGCGTQVDDVDAALASVGRGSLVRTWAFQALGYDNKNARTLDFTGIDRVVRAAERQGVLLELVLSDQAGTCDDGRWHDREWYDGGYRFVHNDDGRGLTTVSYEQWVELVVRRYADSPAVAMWGPVNEPEAADCKVGRQGGGCYGHGVCPPDAAAVLRGFYDRIGGLIHRLDPGSIVASGVIGGGQCGLAGGGYAEVHGSPGIDVATFHDYGAERDALPEELAERLRQAEMLGKPLLVEEAGIGASDDPADRCASRQERAGLLRAKAEAAYAAGADGYLPWWWDPGRPGGCSHAVVDGDPALNALRAAGDAAGETPADTGGGTPGDTTVETPVDTTGGTPGACPSGAVPEDGFTDVPDTNVHEPSIDCLVWYGVARGRTSTEYAPARGVTRGQVATFLANLITTSGGSLADAPRDVFPDDDGSVHEANINRLAQAGIVTGRPDGTYGPGSPVSRGAMATVLVRAYEYRAGQTLPAVRDYFSDDNGTTHELNINKAAAVGFTGGNADGSYRSGATVARDQMASFLARMLDRLAETGQTTRLA